MTKALPDKPAKLPKVREKDGKLEIVMDDRTEEGRRSLFQCFGTTEPMLIQNMVEYMAKVSVAPKDKYKQHTVAQLAILQSIGPQDAAEGMLAIQMLAMHNLLVRCTYRANLDDQTSYGIESNTARVIKLGRTYAAQLQALKDYRNRGKQTIQVKHVNVSDNAQAVIGDIHQGGGGRWVNGRVYPMS